MILKLSCVTGFVGLSVPHWPAHQSLTGHPVSLVPPTKAWPPIRSQRRWPARQGLGPQTHPSTDPCAAYLPAPPTVNTAIVEAGKSHGGDTLGFSQGKESRCLGKETALGNRGCSSDPPMGFTAKVQGGWSPQPLVKTSHSTDRETESLECHFPDILRSPLSLFPAPVPQVPME